MSIVPFLFWAASLIVGLIVYMLVAKAIEKSGLERLGATGSLFTCEPKTGARKAEDQK